MSNHFIGVDVGTHSARAGIFDAAGAMAAGAANDIVMHRDGSDQAEQESSDIWRAVCACVRSAVSKAGLSARDIGGIGFDATCSLVVLGKGGAPLPVHRHGTAARNVIVWMDHRAADQARRINRSGHRVLDHVGGRISPEMETPKLLWLKENLPETWGAAWQFMDLADFLTWRATGSLARSVCTVTCKWTYLAHEQCWDDSYFRAVGLGDLADDGFARIGTDIRAPGSSLGNGLSARAAADLGLSPGTAVGAGLIDAHAGGVGTVGGSGGSGQLGTRMAYVLGTSACTMASSAAPLFIPGVWGPYMSAMVPGMWLSEGGQSSAGAAIDRLLEMHPAAAEARAAAAARGRGLPEHLADLALDTASSPAMAARLAGGLLVVPDFLGNRSPHAEPQARAVIAGLDMGRDTGSLVALYLAGITGIGYGLRQILETSRTCGAGIETIVPSGGGGRHPLVRQLLADCSGLPLEIPQTPEPVLLGAAMLGATAAGAFPSLSAAMAAMSAMAATVPPAGEEVAALHDRRFAAFETLQGAARSARRILED